jgi:hypothetical protein
LDKEYRPLSFSLCSFLLTLVTSSLRPKYSPQHPILIHLQPTFLHQCERPRFLPIHHKNIILCILISNFGVANWKAKYSAPALTSVCS